MEQPTHDLRAHAPTLRENSGRRTAILIGVGILHVGLVWALIAGLASGLIEKLPEEIKAEVVPPKDVVKPPPPPPPDLAKPPPPFVPPPELNIASDAPTNAIAAVQPNVATPPAPPPPAAPAPTQLSAVTRTHTLPPYPDLSIRMQEQGNVTLRVTIDESGNCTDAVVTTSSGSQRLDQAAINWVKSKWKWNPPTQNGKPTSAQTLVQVQFNLKNAH